jgi:CDGSH-type Zn-finger protein
MADVKIQVKPNGPLLIDGLVEIINHDGQTVAQDTTKKLIALCRCGRSSRKPFCDGSHSRSGWSHDECFVPPVIPGPGPTGTT